MRDVRMKGFAQRADVEEVERFLEGVAQPLAAEPVPVTDCAGRVLADDVQAALDVPGFRRAAMDGYAVRGEDTFGASAYDALSLRVLGEALPGRPFAGTLGRGEAVRIMTGAPVPDGADAVVKAEVCEEEGDRVAVCEPVAPRRNVGAVGEDVRQGEVLLRAGRLLRPQDAGLLASLGVSPVSCVRIPRVRLVVTGDELLPPGSRPQGAHIVDSNSVVLRALVARDAGACLPHEILPDRPERVRAALAAPDADLVLVSGGSSVGKEDHAPRLVAELGRLDFHGVAMRPSSPAGVGRLPARPGEGTGERLVFLLPGNPVSCLCAYEFFAGPALRSLGGRSRRWPHRRVVLPLARKIASEVGRVDYVRVAVERGRVIPLATSGASILSSTVRAAGAVIVPRDHEGMPEGAEVEVLLYDDELEGGCAVKQRQFLDVIDRDEAEGRWRAVVDAAPREMETVALEEALGRVLAEDVRAEVDVPGFDRSNMDGFAVRAADSFGATEDAPVHLRLNPETIPTGIAPSGEVAAGTATTIATGGMLPRGADAVVPVEQTDVEDEGLLLVRRATVPGSAVSFAGTDMGRGETVLFAGTRLSSRETGVLAAIGCARVPVVRRPRVAILSTGDEIVQPGQAMRPGLVYDSNGRILADAVRELGGEPVFLGAFRDDEAALREALAGAIAAADVVLLSGGTSKGEGDLCGRVVGELEPGVIVHGVALKPGKPICLAASGTKPVVILPGFPTSAVFTFHEFVAPVVRRMAGLPEGHRESVRARLALRTRSERGRLEYLLVGLVQGEGGGLAAYPMGKGSGSVTAFSRADGFVRLGRNTEIVEADTELEVTLVGHELAVADLVVIGSHCAGLDVIAGALGREGFTVKLLAVGSQGGLAAASRGECDAAPIHLLDPETGRYNAPFLGPELRLLPGYQRMQGVVTRPEETRDLEALLADPELRMVNRNRGAGTRILIDGLLGERRPPGFAYEPRSHYAVAAAVAQKRADWGVTIETVARQTGLRFRPLRAEHYDFAIPAGRWERPAVQALGHLLEPGTPLRAELTQLGFDPPNA